MFIYKEKTKPRQKISSHERCQKAHLLVVSFTDKAKLKCSRAKETFYVIISMLRFLFQKKFRKNLTGLGLCVLMHVEK